MTGRLDFKMTARINSRRVVKRLGNAGKVRAKRELVDNVAQVHHCLEGAVSGIARPAEHSLNPSQAWSVCSQLM